MLNKSRLLTLVYHQNINMLRLVVTATLTAAEPDHNSTQHTSRLLFSDGHD
jgi:hypothetical protein